MEYKEINIGKHGDLANNGMKKVEAEGNDILLCKSNGKFHALGAKCPHYGASLEEGLLHEGKIICPWHHATFDLENGDVIEPPSKDCLMKFELEVREDEIIVRIPDEFSGSRQCEMTKYDPKSDDRTFVIIGTGASGSSAAETLRKNGYKGKIVMISNEKRLPYDRPNLSKEYMQGIAEESWMPLHSEDFYDEKGIELKLGVEVMSVGIGEKTVSMRNADKIKFDKLLIATGGRPRNLNVDGVGLEGVFTLRSYDDADNILSKVDSAKKAVVVGTSFIGMEVASSLRDRDVDVTVVAPESVPFEYVLGKDVGRLIQNAHEKKDVNFKLGKTVKEFKGDQVVEKVILDNDEELNADLVVIGIGVEPVAKFIDAVDKNDDGSIKVDEFFAVTEDIFAAGDIASFPYWRSGEELRIEHWRTAEQQGIIAARNMLGERIPFKGVPFFWTNQAGLYMGYVGHASEWDNVIIHEDSESGRFIAYYIHNGTINAALANSMEREIDIIDELMRRNKMPSPEQVKEGFIDLSKFLP
ncbi:MAG: Rieske 2Fe-2S domain-containing protein [candidate division Zixibacteria bacterium]|nr:Rieske 2Fe-2S domain-containing protein [candidate division Zixibacteria bacterium]